MRVDSDHRGFKFHTNRNGFLPVFSFPVFTLTSFSEHTVWNLSGMGALDYAEKLSAKFYIIIAFEMGETADKIPQHP